jgi:hypothetical protein
MRRKRNILFIISAIILIPILLGLTPVKFVQKLGSGCPFAQSKAAFGCNPCIYHSVTSKVETGNLAMAGPLSAPFVFQSLPLLSGETGYSDLTVVSNPPSDAPQLRC